MTTVIMINNQMTFSCDHNTQSDNDRCDDDTERVSWSQLNIIIWLCIMITAECHCLVVYHIIHSKIMTFSCDHNTQSDNDSCDHDKQPDNDI
jgi:hypothetical protein